MNRLRKYLIVILCAALFMCSFLVACDEHKDSGKATYTVNVITMGGLGLSNIDVTVSKSDATIASGTTNKNGKFTFSASKGVYTVDVGNLPIGYSLVDTNTYTTAADNYTLNIFATSSVIKEEIPSDKLYKEGDVIYDFTITDRTDVTNPVSYTLSEVLKTKKMVLLNFWNTQCGPCMSEMPELELAYREYKSSVEVFGISVPLYATDRIGAVRDLRNSQFIDSEGQPYYLTFPLEIDSNSMPLHFDLGSIPVNVVVDRYGVIASIHVGSLDKATFLSLFAKYTADDYVQDGALDGDDGDNADDGDELVRVLPTATMPDSSEIEQAINGTGFTGSYYPETETEDAEYSWPWLVGETDGVKYIYPSNHEVNYSFATIYTKVNISSDDIASENGKIVLAFDLQWSCENLADNFYVIVNNAFVYEYTGTEHWGTWQTCYAIVADEPGEYVLGLLYDKDPQNSVGADTVRVKNIRMLSVSQIDVPSLDMPREAARGWNGNTYQSYVSVVKDADGFYHKDTENGPYIVAELMGVSSFNNRLTSDWGISEFAINGFFNDNPTDDVDDPAYDPARDDTDAISIWLMASNNSELYGVTLINDELKALLEKFIKKQVGESKFTNNMWLEFCRYFDHYGTDDTDKGICSPERNPIRGLLDSTAVSMVDAHDGPFEDLTDIPDEYKNKVVLDRLIVPRGFKYVFIPEQDGVYRFRSQSQQLSDTMGWISNYGAATDDYLVSTDEQLENADEEYNFVITYYLKAGVKYILSTCFADIGGTGEYTITTEYLGPEYYVWQFASRNYFTTSDDTMSTIVNYMNVQPVLHEGYYYNAQKDENGNYKKDGGNYVPNLADPIYVDFLTGARFFDYGTLERVFDYSNEATIIRTLSDIFASIWNKTKPSAAGWQSNVPLYIIKGGSELTTDDWIEILTALYNTYGDAVYIDDDVMLEALTQKNTIGEVAGFIKAFYLNMFDLSYVTFPGIDIEESRYTDYTDTMLRYYNLAKANNGDPARGYADKGCTKLTPELKDALDMFCKRIGGFPELDTDWIRLCAHYEYFGPYTAD